VRGGLNLSHISRPSQSVSSTMRLLNAHTLQMEEFFQKAPEYAILSHTWGVDEVSFDDVRAGLATQKEGYKKISYTCKQALEDEISHVWIDTCCIDKTSSSELSEAINSMFKWYRDASVCYAYLADISIDEERIQAGWENTFTNSR
jgi:hypothetical protein